MLFRSPAFATGPLPASARVPGTRQLPAGAEAGLRAALYGVRPARRREVGGPAGRGGGYIDVTLLFTTDPGIPAWHLAVLADDRGLQLAANVTPPVRRDVIVGYGPNLVAVLNKVPALLDAGTLRAADARVELARRKSPGWWPAAGCAHRG